MSIYTDVGSSQGLTVTAAPYQPSTWQQSLSAVGSFGGAIGGLIQGGLNYFQQKKQFEYQKELQQQLFQREDTAMQRRRADLEAAGLNPQLAAGGSGASAGSVVPVNAPQASGMDSLQSLSSLMALATQASTVARTQAEIDRINADVEGQYLRNSILGNDLQYLRMHGGNRMSNYKNSWIDDIMAVGGLVGDSIEKGTDAMSNTGSKGLPMTIVSSLLSLGSKILGFDK